MMSPVVRSSVMAMVPPVGRLRACLSKVSSPGVGVRAGISSSNWVGVVAKKRPPLAVSDSMRWTFSTFARGAS